MQRKRIEEQVAHNVLTDLKMELTTLIRFDMRLSASSEISSSIIIYTTHVITKLAIALLTIVIITLIIVIIVIIIIITVTITITIVSIIC